MKITVIDTETTGLDGHPIDYVVEISVCEIDTKTRKVDVLYDSVVGYDVDKWKLDISNIWIFNNSSLNVDLVKEARNFEIIVKEVQVVVKDKVVTSYNIGYDFDNFLDYGIWGLQDYYSRKFDCIMLMAMEKCKIPGNEYYGGYKWPRLEEAVKILNVEVKFEGEFHRSLYDTIMSSYVLLKMLDEDGNFVRNDMS